MVTAYSAFQRLAQRCGPPGTPVADPPCTLPPIPSDAAVALLTVGLKEDMIPKLTDLGYTDEPTSVFKVNVQSLGRLLSAVLLLHLPRHDQVCYTNAVESCKTVTLRQSGSNLSA